MKIADRILRRQPGKDEAAPEAGQKPLDVSLSSYPEYRAEKEKLQRLLEREAQIKERVASLSAQMLTASGAEQARRDNVDKLAASMLKGEDVEASPSLETTKEEYLKEQTALTAVREAIRLQRITLDHVKGETASKISTAVKPEYSAIVVTLAAALVELVRATDAERLFSAKLFTEGSRSLSALPSMALGPEFNALPNIVAAWFHRALSAGYVEESEVPSELKPTKQQVGPASGEKNSNLIPAGYLVAPPGSRRSPKTDSQRRQELKAAAAV